MRMSTGAERDEELAVETITAAVEAGVSVFDTARAYGYDELELGHNERLLARALRCCGAEREVRVVTKGGMARPGGRWMPDGRAKAINSDCEASLAALAGLAIDLYLIHAPDPRTPRGSRRTMRGVRNRADRPLSAWRPTPRGPPPSSARVGRDRRRAWRDGCRGRARMAARAFAGCRRDPRRPSSGDRAVGSLRCLPRPRRRCAGDPITRVRRGSAGARRTRTSA